MTGNDCLPPSVRPEGSLKVVQFFSFPPLRSWVSCSAVQPFLWNATGRCTPSSLIPTSLTEAGQHFSPPDVSRHFPPLADFIVREDFLLRRMKATESFLKKNCFICTLSLCTPSYAFQELFIVVYWFLVKWIIFWNYSAILLSTPKSCVSLPTKCSATD